MALETVLACLDGMSLGEIIPVLLLIRGEDTGAAAQRADATQRSENGGADELRPVGHILDYSEQAFIYFEGDGFLFLPCRASLTTQVLLMNTCV